MVRNTKKVIHILLGAALIPIGIAGLVLPILNGTVLLIVGLIILSFESKYVEDRLRSITKRNTTLTMLHEKLEVFLRKILRN